MNDHPLTWGEAVLLARRTGEHDAAVWMLESRYPAIYAGAVAVARSERIARAEHAAQARSDNGDPHRLSEV